METAFDDRRFAEALEMAGHWHAGQRRKGTAIPYVAHLLDVAAIALYHGADTDEAIAALLHDAIEDAGVTREQLAERFGERVAQVVEACTDDLPGVDRASVDGWRARKDAYLSHLQATLVRAADGDALSLSIALVGASDKLANARSIASDREFSGDAVFERFKAGRDGTLWYYRALASLYDQSSLEIGRHRPPLDALFAELGRVVDRLDL